MAGAQYRHFLGIWKLSRLPAVLGRKLPGQGCEHSCEIHTRRRAPPGSPVSHDNCKPLDGVGIDLALAATHSKQTGGPEHGPLDADEHGVLRPCGGGSAER